MDVLGSPKINTMSNLNYYNNNQLNQNRNQNQSPQLQEIRLKKLKLLSNPSNYYNNNNNNKSGEAYLPSIIDINPKEYSRGPQFEKMYKKEIKTVSDIFNELKSKQQSEEISPNYFNENNNDNLEAKTNTKYSKISLFKQPAFLRQLHQTGPKFLSQEIVSKALSEHRQQLYSSVDNCVDNPEYIQKANSKELALRYNTSDVFNLKSYNPSEKPKQPKLKRLNSDIKIDFHDSDIFLLKNNKTSLSKSSERLNPIIPKYGMTTKSDSEFATKNYKGSLFNHESTELNILNLAVKGNSQTKQKILEENIGSTHKKKSIAEIADITRTFSPNPNIKYLQALNNNSKEFRQTSNVCGNYGNLFHSYQSAVDYPFSKKV